MDKPENARYLCRNQVAWKAVFILIFGVSALWALVLFIPRRGNPEKDQYFYLLLFLGLGIDLLILYLGLLRRWAKTWIADEVVHSDFASRMLVPISKRMELAEVREVCFIFNASLSRKKIAYPNSKAFKQLKSRLAEKIDALVTSRQFTEYASLDDDKYSFPAYCGRLILKGGDHQTLPVDLNVTFYRANLKEVRKFLTFLPAETRYTWRFGRVSIPSKSSMF